MHWFRIFPDYFGIASSKPLGQQPRQKEDPPGARGWHRGRGQAVAGITCDRSLHSFRLNKITGPLRRALIYGAVSYVGLVLINNAELDLPNMWIAYLPMFVSVYVLTQWLDRKLGS